MISQISSYQVCLKGFKRLQCVIASSITRPRDKCRLQIGTVLFALLLATPCFASANPSIFQSLPDDPRAVVVTRQAFGAVGGGIADDAPALQAAIDQVERTTRQGIVLLPEGRYRLRSTIYVWTGIRIIGIGSHRPVLVLAKDTPGFQHGSGHYMVHFAGDKPAPGKPVVDASARTFYSGMMNIDFEIEDGNPTAVAIRFHVAQHSFLSHMDFSLGTAYAGLEDIGNQASDLHFHGGNYGIATGKTSPGWQFLLMDSTFDGQHIAAIRTQEAGMTLIRDRFEHMPTAVQIPSGEVEQLYLKDSFFRKITQTALSLGETRNFRSQITVDNVVCEDVSSFSTDEHDASIEAPAPFYRVHSFNRGLAINNNGREAGVRTAKQIEKLASLPEMPASDVPALPALETWINAHQIGAKGDGVTDDTAALQAAVDTHRTVYLPTGRYRLTATLRLRPDTVLVGLNPITTQLILQDATPAFHGIGSPVPMVMSATGGNAIISGIGISTGAINQRVTGLLWKAGPHSFVDDVKFIGGHGSVDPDGRWSLTYDADHTGDPNPARAWDAQYPSFWVNGGGGVFRNVWTASTFARAGFVVQHTSVPGTIYQLSSEHHVRNEVQFDDVKHWDVYALQLETEKNEGAEAIALTLRNSSELKFSNLFIYRVSRVLVPAPVAVLTQSAANIQFQNVHSYSGTRFAFDRTIADQDSNLRVAAHNFTSFQLTDSAASAPKAALPSVFTAQPKLLASGFSNASGMATDINGDPYFTDARLQHIFHWSVKDHRLLLVQNEAIAPVVLTFDKQALLVVSSVKSIVRIEPPSGELQAIQPSALPAKITDLLLPIGTHTGLQQLRELLAGTTEASVSEYQGIMAGGGWLALLQSSQLGRLHVGTPAPLTCENDAVTWTVTLHSDHTLTAEPKIFRGGSSVLQDTQGNFFIAESQVFIYDRHGNQSGVLELPEQPTSLAFGGADHKTLFITTRHLLYAVPLKLAGQ